MRWATPLIFVGAAGAVATFLPATVGERDALVLVLGLLGVMVVLSDLIEMSLGRVFTPRSHFWCFVIAPGTILHELGHYFACKLVGLEVLRVRLFEPNPRTRQLGYVSFKMPAGDARWSVLQGLVVAFAPFVSGSLALFLLVGLLLPSGLWPELELSRFDRFGGDLGLLIDHLRRGVVRPGRLGSWRWLVLYGVLVVGSGAAPSTTDFLIPLRHGARRLKASLTALVVLGGASILLMRWPLALHKVASVLAIAACCQVASLLVSLALRAARELLRRGLGDRR
jgi:hypothetical protein